MQPWQMRGQESKGKSRLLRAACHEPYTDAWHLHAKPQGISSHGHCVHVLQQDDQTHPQCCMFSWLCFQSLQKSNHFAPGVPSWHWTGECCVYNFLSKKLLESADDKRDVLAGLACSLRKAGWISGETLPGNASRVMPDWHELAYARCRLNKCIDSWPLHSWHSTTLQQSRMWTWRKRAAYSTFLGLLLILRMPGYWKPTLRWMRTLQHNQHKQANLSLQIHNVTVQSQYRLLCLFSNIFCNFFFALLSCLLEPCLAQPQFRSDTIFDAWNSTGQTTIACEYWGHPPGGIPWQWWYIDRHQLQLRTSAPLHLHPHSWLRGPKWHPWTRSHAGSTHGGSTHACSRSHARPWWHAWPLPGEQVSKQKRLLPSKTKQSNENFLSCM